MSWRCVHLASLFCEMSARAHDLGQAWPDAHTPAQEISDTIALRKRIQDCFELAALPGTPEADITHALHFIVVGGGPTVCPPCILGFRV